MAELSAHARPVRIRLALAMAIGVALVLALAGPVAGAVPGDDPADAIAISPAQFGTAQAYDTTGATTATDDPAACSSESGEFTGPFTETVWHAFTPATTGPLVVDVNSFPEGSPGFLAILFVFEESGGTLTQIGCSAFPATVQFDAQAGHTYLFMTGSLPETPGGGPALITVAVPLITDLTIDARAVFHSTDHSITVSGTVTCTGTGRVDIFVSGEQTIGQATVRGSGFASVSCEAGTVPWSASVSGETSIFNPGALEVFADAFGCAPVCSDVHASGLVNAVPDSNKPGPPPPPLPSNDEPGGAIAISSAETLEEDTSAATAAASDPQECPREGTPPSDHTVWFSLTATADGWIEVNTIGSEYDTTLFVIDAGTVVACDDDLVPGFDQDSQLAFLATSGTTYLIMVGTFDGSPGGHLVLNTLPTAEPPPPPPPPLNDERADAIPVTVGTPVDGDSSAATTNALTDDVACPDTGQLGHTVWYTVTPSATGWLRASLQNATFPGGVAVLDGDTVVRCSFDAAIFLADAGTTYTILIGSAFSLPGGTFTLDVEPSEPLLEIFVTIDPVAALNTQTGEATFTGTVTCSLPVDADVLISVSQAGGRFVATGGGAIGPISCGPIPVAWTITLTGDTAKFQPGSVDVSVEAFAGTETQFVGTSVEAQVELVPTKH